MRWPGVRADALAPARRQEGVVRLLALAVLWLAAAALADFLVAFAMAFVTSFHNSAMAAAGSPRWVVAPGARLVLATAVLQAALLFASYRRSKVVGSGERWVGLGAGPLRHVGSLAVLVVVAFVAVPAWAVVLGKIGVAAPKVGLSPILTGNAAGTGGLVLLIVEICIGAPLAEEMFFRGWLWTGLRHRWPTLPVASLTGALWLATHLGEGLAKPLFIIPMAVVLSVARARCGGIWASVLIHMANNSIAVVAVLLVQQLHH